MFSFFARLFQRPKSPPRQKVYLLESYCCRSTIRVKKRIRTPGQSLVTVLRVLVDIEYSVDRGRILINDVCLSKKGTTIVGSNARLNVSSDRTGEAWYSNGPGDKALMMQAVLNDLRNSQTGLVDELLHPWKSENQALFAREVAEALNRHWTAEQIDSILQYCTSYLRLEFVYTKEDGSVATRVVTLDKLSGQCIWALDHKDDKMKTFRIDRISNARAIL